MTGTFIKQEEQVSLEVVENIGRLQEEFVQLQQQVPRGYLPIKKGVSVLIQPMVILANFKGGFKYVGYKNC